MKFAVAIMCLLFAGYIVIAITRALMKHKVTEEDNEAEKPEKVQIYKPKFATEI